MLLRRILRLGALLTLLAVIAVLTLRDPSPSKTAAAVVPVAPPPAPALDAYGLEADRFTVETATIRRGQTFSEIVTQHGVPAERVSDLVAAAEGVFDVRYLRAGDDYRVYRTKGTARHLVYERDRINYVVFDLGARPRVTTGTRPIQTVRRQAEGVITSSLYETMRGADATAATYKLAEVFAWQIDFQSIQRGDRVEVVYEERQVDGEAVGVGEVLAARFVHDGHDYYAFYYDHGDVRGYFDERGNSLRKVLLKSPLKFSRVTSGYTKRRFHPVLKRYKAHLGTDYAAPHGTEIFTTGDGVVLEAGYKRGNGNYVKIRHNTTYTTGYLHMSTIAEGIRPGARVRQGDLIGYVGSTGLATGPHVCYRFWKNGVQVDPRKEEMPPSEPIPAAHRATYDALLGQWMPALTTPASHNAPAS